MDIRQHLGRHATFRWLVLVLCTLQMLAVHGAHARPASDTVADHLFCGTPTAAGLAPLADWAPADYAKALGRLAGAGDDCGAHCAGGAPPLPSSAQPLAFGRPCAAQLPARAAAAPPLARFGPRKPPSTAPPSQA